jgi:NAD(P)-dependent dehydrogenase (short-subunit alcohol dehydrogenase family)
MGNTISQVFPPEAKFTEKNLPDQTGKVCLPFSQLRSNVSYNSYQQVFIVTGSSSGVGKELAQILYSHNAKVYFAARSAEKTAATIESVKTAFPNSKGQAIYLHLDLDDLTTIKASANEFLSKEDKLNVLWNNAGVMVPPQGSKTKQGYELQLGTNNVAPFLFTKLLTPILIKTAKSEPPGTVRVVWTSSSAAEGISPKNGVDMNDLNYKVDKSAWHKYGVSKAGNVFHSKEFAKRYAGDGLISVVCSLAPPHNLRLVLTATVSQPRKPQDSPPTQCTWLADDNDEHLLTYSHPWCIHRVVRGFVARRYARS